MDHQETLRQIGQDALMFTGARNYVAGTDRLTFNVGRGNAWKVVVILAPDDTYTVELWNINMRKVEFTRKWVCEGVYADNLAGTVVDATANI